MIHSQCEVLDNEWLDTPAFSIEDAAMAVKANESYLLALSDRLQESIGDLSFVSINDESEPATIHNKAPTKKTVSWGDKVEVREYLVVQGDHPNCKLPLSLDWEYTTCEKDTALSRQRMGKYKAPKRLSLEDRRQRLYGDVQDNLTEFALMDDNLDELMKGLDDLLSEAAMPDLPVLIAPGLPTSLPPMPSLEDNGEPPSSFDFDLATTTSIPKSLAAYEEFFSTPKVKDVPIVRWRRVVQNVPTVQWRRVVRAC